MSLEQIVDKMVRGDVVRHTVTFPEGTSLEDMARIAAIKGIPAEAFLAAARNPAPVQDLDPDGEGPRGVPLPGHLRHPARRRPGGPARRAHGPALPRGDRAGAAGGGAERPHLAPDRDAGLDRRDGDGAPGRAAPRGRGVPEPPAEADAAADGPHRHLRPAQGGDLRRQHPQATTWTSTRRTTPTATRACRRGRSRRPDARRSWPSLHPAPTQGPVLREPQRRQPRVQRDAGRARALGHALPAAPPRGAAGARCRLAGAAVPRPRRGALPAAPRRGQSGRAYGRPVADRTRPLWHRPRRRRRRSRRRSSRWLLLLALVANGRPIGAGDTRPPSAWRPASSRKATSTSTSTPRSRSRSRARSGATGSRSTRSLSAVLAAPVFAAARALFALDETGLALAGKWAASLFSGLPRPRCCTWPWPAAVPHREALWTAVVFALGTTRMVHQPGAVAAPGRRARPLCGAFSAWCARRKTTAWAGRAGLPLALAVAARHADVALVAVLALGDRRPLAAAQSRTSWPGRRPRPVLCWPISGPTSGRRSRHGFSGRLERFTEPWGEGHLGLLVSPGKGLLRLHARRAGGGARAWCARSGYGERAAGRHLRPRPPWRTGSHGPLDGMARRRIWGPRLMTDALPLLFLFLPDGLRPRCRG